MFVLQTVKSFNAAAILTPICIHKNTTNSSPELTQQGSFSWSLVRSADCNRHEKFWRNRRTKSQNKLLKTRCGPMPNVMAALPNITPQFGWRPLYRVLCSNAAKTRNQLKFAGCPKPANRSQPLVDRSYVWRRYQCLTSFFPIVDTCLSCEDTGRQSCAMMPK